MTPLSTAAVALLEEARSRIKANNNLTPRKRNDWRASINAIIAKARPNGRVTGGPTPEAEIDRLLSEVLRSATRSDKANISRTRAALMDLGYDIPNGWGRKALGGAWATARSEVAPDKWSRLMTLPEWAEAAGIDPSEISGRHLTAYAAFRRKGNRAQKGERQRFLALVDSWREVCGVLRISVPHDLPGRAHEAYRYCYPEYSWSPELRADVERAARLLVTKAEPWRIPSPSSLDTYRDALYRFASAHCRSTGAPPSQLKSLEPLLTVSCVLGIRDYLSDRSGRFRPAERASAPYAATCLACFLAEYCYLIDDRTRAALIELRRELAPPLSLELSSERQARAQQFEDPKAVRSLFRVASLKLAEFERAPEVDPHLLAQACAALGLYFGVTFALHAFSLASCVVRSRGAPCKGTAAEIVETSGGGVTMRIARTTRFGEREFAVTGVPLDLYRMFRDRTSDLPGCTKSVLLPAPSGGQRSPVALGRSITALMAKANLAVRVTAGDMPTIAAVAIFKHPFGTPELARRQLGRNWHAEDPLFETIERWQRDAVRDGTFYDGR